MAFLDDARDALNEDELATLKRLNQKSADFEAAPDEEIALYNLKKKVKDFVSTRDRQKNLQVIAAKAYPIGDILQVSGYSKKEVQEALNKLFPRAKSDETEPITTVGAFDFRGNKRYGRNKDYDAFKKAGLKKAVAGLTDFGKEWLNTEETKAGNKVHPNKALFVKMFNENVENLDKLLGVETKPAQKAVKV